jgi:hypothetical protein
MNKRRAETFQRTKSGGRSQEKIFLSKIRYFFSETWFLSYNAPNQMKFGHKGHLNTRNKFPKSFFFQI